MLESHLKSHWNKLHPLSTDMVTDFQRTIALEHSPERFLLFLTGLLNLLDTASYTLPILPHCINS